MAQSNGQSRSEWFYPDLARVLQSPHESSMKAKYDFPIIGAPGQAQKYFRFSPEFPVLLQ